MKESNSFIAKLRVKLKEESTTFVIVLIALLIATCDFRYEDPAEVDACYESKINWVIRLGGLI